MTPEPDGDRLEGTGPAHAPARRDDAGTGGRRPTPGPTVLLALYPAAWRRRYGDELDALIVDMHADGRDPDWRLRADLWRSALRERLRAGRDRDPSARIRGGASLVLWAWAVFVLAGVIVAKTSEHWQQVPAAHPSSAASLAFGGLTVAAIVAAMLVTAGIAMSLPAATRFLRDGGWREVRRRVLVAMTLSVLVAPATVALVVWANRLSVDDRNGHDGLYAAAVVCWAVLGAALLLAWTAVATRLARGLRCRRAVLRGLAVLAPAVAMLMAAMTAATAAWWVIVGFDHPAALTGGGGAARPTALVPQLVVAAGLMVIATAAAGIGAARSDLALPDL